MVSNICCYIYNYTILIIWFLYTYFIGIYIDHIKLNIFDIHILLTIISIYGLFNSIITILLDKNHPIDTLKQLKMVEMSDKIKIFISCLPFNKIHVFAYIDSDPILITIFSSLGIILNLFVSAFYNKKYYLLTKLNILMASINIVFCILPFILNEDFTIKLNGKLKIGSIGIITCVLSVVLTCVSNIFGENIKLIKNVDVKNNCCVLFIFTFFIVEVIVYILFTPIVYIIQHYLIKKIIFDFDKLFYLSSIGGLFALFYGPFYVICTKSYLILNAIDIGIVRNICLILTTVISCLVGVSKFYYLYIPSIILIILSSLVLIYNTSRLYEINNIV